MGESDRPARDRGVRYAGAIAAPGISPDRRRCGGQRSVRKAPPAWRLMREKSLQPRVRSGWSWISKVSREHGNRRTIRFQPHATTDKRLFARWGNLMAPFWNEKEATSGRRIQAL